jgi:hypothetical protein
MQSRVSRMEHESYHAKNVHKTADYTMKTYEEVVRVLTVGLGGAVTITLPPLEECRGQFKCVHLEDAVQNVVITDGGDDTIWSDVTLTAANDYVMVYSDGYRWLSVSEVST